MKNGGYKIIDLKDTNLTTSASATLSGIYEAIESNYRKPILLSGIVINGVEKADAFVTVNVSNSNFVISNLYGMNLTITDEDAITTANVDPSLHSYCIYINGAATASDNTSISTLKLFLNLTTKTKITTIQDVYDFVSGLSYYEKIVCTGDVEYTADDVQYKGVILNIDAARGYSSDTSTGFRINYMALNKTEKTITDIYKYKIITEASFIAISTFKITEL